MSALFELEVQDEIAQYFLPKWLLIKDRFGDRVGFLFLGGSTSSEQEIKSLGGTREIILLSERFGDHRIRFPGEEDPHYRDLVAKYGGDMKDPNHPELWRILLSEHHRRDIEGFRLSPKYREIDVEGHTAQRKEGIHLIGRYTTFSPLDGRKGLLAG
jgi:hypothetical protein